VIDENECRRPGVCGQATCVNSVGSYQCQCPSGSTFDRDSMACVGTQPCRLSVFYLPRVLQTTVSDSVGLCWKICFTFLKSEVVVSNFYLFSEIKSPFGLFAVCTEIHSLTDCAVSVPCTGIASYRALGHKPLLKFYFLSCGLCLQQLIPGSVSTLHK